ncbi:MAG: neutral zinc metallopeptidase [Candidatus Limnocylindrales bacterium]
MKWKRNTGFDQIEDRRGMGGGGGGLGGMLGGSGGGGGFPIPGGKAGGGIGGLVIAVVLFLLTSGILGGGGSGLGDLGGLQPGAAQPGGTLNPQSDTDQFVAYVVADIQAFWGETFTASGKDYPETKLVLFDQAGTTSGCGPASPATGPFYCPADQKVYLELGFFDELQSRFGAKGGDFAIAYVIAHEFGHHIQTVTGVSQSVQDQSQQDPSRQNELSVLQELQADCLAGVWAYSAASDVEPGDIDEALSAAAAVGDDRIQESTTGRIDKEGWTHGSAEQRTQWFNTGFTSGDPATCDTFKG